MKKKLNTPKIDILSDRYATAITPEKFFLHLYNESFNIFSSYADVSIQDFLKILFEEYQLSEENYLFKFLHSPDGSLTNISYDESEFLLKIKDRVLLYCINNSLRIYYSGKDAQKELEKLVNLINFCPKSNEHMGRFYMVTKSQDMGLKLKDYEISKGTIDIQNNYNSDFLNVHRIISDFLNCEIKQGVVLLHGKYGTGKTSYIRHLINSVNRRTIFLPINLMDEISSPDFLPFITEYRNSILVIEDCEELLKPRESGNNKNSGLANLLNLGDGLLADALSLKIICTFNANLKHIDQAILRKGRLIARYEFNELEKSKAQALSNQLGFNHPISKPMTLAEIFNQESMDFALNKNMEQIGFR